jgi:hypothetical protein
MGIPPLDGMGWDGIEMQNAKSGTEEGAESFLQKLFIYRGKRLFRC